MKLIDVLKNDELKIVKWFKDKEPEFVDAMQTGVHISGAVLSWVKSGKGQAIEAIIEASVPQAKVWTADVVKIAIAMGADMGAASSPASWAGIAVRLAAEILSIIDGNKLPTGIDGYLAEVQNIFVG